MTDEQHVYHHAEPAGVTVKLDRGQRGGYGWEVRATAATPDEAIELVRQADARLREQYGEPSAP